MPVNIFFSYAHEDESLVNELKKQLKPLQRQDFINIWHDRDITAGMEWEREINEHLNAAHVILLLVSPDFMNSDYCYSVEMKRAMERHERGETQVIPIILRPTYWESSPFGKLYALPTNAKPVMDSYWYNLDSALFNVAEGIRRVVEQLTTPSPATALMSPVEVLNGTQPNSVSSIKIGEFVLMRSITDPGSRVESIAISPDGHLLASSGKDHIIKLWDPQTGQLLRTLTGHSGSIGSITISPDGHLLATGSMDHTIKLWNLQTGQLLRTFLVNAGSSFAMSPNRQLLASRSGWDTIKLWNLYTGEEINSIREISDSNIVMSSDGQLLASGSGGNTIKLWNPQTGELLRTLTGHEINDPPNFTLAMSPDGQLLASSSGDNTIKLWNPQTGQLLRTLNNQSDPFAFSPDGHILATTTNRSQVRLWHSYTGQLLRTLTSQPYSIRSLAISSEGLFCIGGGRFDQGEIEVWGQG